MKKNIIFHNPRCSKSRETLRLIQENGASVDVVEYLKHPPSVSDLKFICEKLKVRPFDLIRVKDKAFTGLGLSKEDERSDNDWIKILADNPALLERPIVVYRGKVAIGRPPERVLGII